MEPRPQSPTTLTPTAQEALSDLERGDDHALAGHWTDAVSAWDVALATDDRERARARLAWLSRDATRATTSRRWRAGPVTIGVVSATVATVLVLIAERQSQATSNALAVAAWALYAVAAICGLLYAYQHRPHRVDIPDDVLTARARLAAMAVENSSGTIGAGSWPVD